VRGFRERARERERERENHLHSLRSTDAKCLAKLPRMYLLQEMENSISSQKRTEFQYKSDQCCAALLGGRETAQDFNTTLIEGE